MQIIYSRQLEELKSYHIVEFCYHGMAVEDLSLCISQLDFTEDLHVVCYHYMVKKSVGHSSFYFVNFLQTFMANGCYIFCLTILFKVAFSEQHQFSQLGPLFFQKKESSHNWVTLVTEWFKHVTCLLVVPKSVKSKRDSNDWL